jgi:hypothetical protein
VRQRPDSSPTGCKHEQPPDAARPPNRSAHGGRPLWHRAAAGDPLGDCQGRLYTPAGVGRVPTTGSRQASKPTARCATGRRWTTAKQQPAVLPTFRQDRPTDHDHVHTEEAMGQR